MASTATALTIVERVEQSVVVKALEARSAALADLLPDEAAVARFKRGVIVAITKNPDLLTCTPESVVMACFEAAQQGLEPTGAAGGAHLVPYRTNGEKRAQLIPDYRGVIRMVTRPGSEVISLEARVVKEGDAFDYQLGTDAFVNHVPSLDAARSQKVTTHVYAIARLKNGAAIPDVEDRAGVERIQNRGGVKTVQSPWATDWDEMAKKTLIKRLAKVLPVRPDVRQILLREDELEGNTDGDAPAAATSGPSRAAQLGSRLRGSKNVTPLEDAPTTPDAPAEPLWAAAPGEAPEDASEPVAAPQTGSLIDRLRTNAQASSLVGQITEPQKAKLGAVIGRPSGLDWSAEVLPVLVEAFGEGFVADEMTAAQAQSVISVAESDGQEAFVAAWRASVPVEA